MKSESEAISPPSPSDALRRIASLQNLSLSRLGLLADTRSTLLGDVSVGVYLVERVERLENSILAPKDPSLEEVGERLVQLVTSVLGHGDGEDAVEVKKDGQIRLLKVQPREIEAY